MKKKHVIIFLLFLFIYSNIWPEQNNNQKSIAVFPFYTTQNNFPEAMAFLTHSIPDVISREIIEKELYDVGIRLDQFPPLISIYKTQQGGVALTTTVTPLNYIDEDLVKSIFKEFRIINALVTVHQDVNIDQVIDVLAGNRV